MPTCIQLYSGQREAGATYRRIDIEEISRDQKLAEIKTSKGLQLTVRQYLGTGLYELVPCMQGKLEARVSVSIILCILGSQIEDCCGGAQQQTLGASAQCSTLPLAHGGAKVRRVNARAVLAFQQSPAAVLRVGPAPPSSACPACVRCFGSRRRGYYNSMSERVDMSFRASDHAVQPMSSLGVATSEKPENVVALSLRSPAGSSSGRGDLALWSRVKPLSIQDAGRSSPRRVSISTSVLSEPVGRGGRSFDINSKSLSELRATCVHNGARRHELAAALDNRNPKAAMFELAKMSTKRKKREDRQKLYGYDEKTRTYTVRGVGESPAAWRAFLVWLLMADRDGIYDEESDDCWLKRTDPETRQMEYFNTRAQITVRDGIPAEFATRVSPPSWPAVELELAEFYVSTELQQFQTPLQRLGVLSLDDLSEVAWDKQVLNHVPSMTKADQDLLVSGLRMKGYSMSASLMLEVEAVYAQILTETLDSAMLRAATSTVEDIIKEQEAAAKRKEELKRRLQTDVRRRTSMAGHMVQYSRTRESSIDPSSACPYNHA
eukprot:COSAG05_NODE_406_length_10149_cov_13.684478_1_plen_549_part_00